MHADDADIGADLIRFSCHGRTLVDTEKSINIYKTILSKKTLVLPKLIISPTFLPVAFR